MSCEKKHDPVVFSLKTGGSLSLCLKCRAKLFAPKTMTLSQEEVDALVEFAIHMRDKNPKLKLNRGPK